MAAINHSNLALRSHIQDHHAQGVTLKNYWGYAVRVLPCKNDQGTCEYLDAVYGMHETSMLYTFILWIIIGAIVLTFVLSRLFRAHRAPAIIVGEQESKQGFYYRSRRAFASASRKYLGSEAFPKLFPYTTRLQILVLAILCVYLTIFSLVGIVYKTWITPIEGSDKHNTRTGLGGFSDRVGAFAYALTPLTIALCSRDSILSLFTGIPYQNFNFLHRWTGRIILVQSFIHTIGWTIIEGKLYQPQPDVYVNWISQTYMIWGIVAQGFLTFLFVFSLRPVIRWTGYEFFRKTHYIVAGLYLGACWGHWEQLACWMIASLGLYGIDLVLRYVRVCLIHVGYKDSNKGLGFRAIKSKIEVFKDPSGTIVRMSFTHNHRPWKVGQHYYLTFPSLSIWQSHPFTPASVPPTALVPPTHTYIIRARNGETGKLAALAEQEIREKEATVAEIPVILLGAYGRSIIDTEAANILAIAGGTGVSFTLPVVMSALADPTSQTQNIEMIWIVRHIDNLAWIAPELLSLKEQLSSRPTTPVIEDSGKLEEAAIMTSVQNNARRLRIRIFVTRAPETRTHIHPTGDKEVEMVEISSGSSSNSAPSHSEEVQELLLSHPNFSVTYLQHERPCMSTIVDTFINDTVSSGRTQVVGSGPAQLGTDIRAAVAAKNNAGGVWRGDDRMDVDCVWDDRMG